MERSAVMPKESVQMGEKIKNERDRRGRGDARAEREHFKANRLTKTKLKSKKSEEIIQGKIYHPGEQPRNGLKEICMLTSQ